MSAYALPGLVFPPQSAPPPTPSYSRDAAISKSGSNSIVDSPIPNETSSRRCNLSSSTSESSLFNRYLGSSLLNTESERTVESKCADDRSEGESNSEGFTVAVKGARIDVLQLINMTFSSSSSSTTKDSNASLSSSSKGSLSCPARRDRRRRLIQRIRHNWPSSSAKSSSAGDEENPQPSLEGNSSTSSLPQDGAIHFELSVSYRDRHYEAVRSLARIRQLYRELLDVSEDDEETKEDSSEADIELGIQRHMSFLIEKPLANDVNEVSTRSRPRRSRQGIPALPEMFQERCNPITNLRLLYAQLHQNYAPAIESWFRKVFAVVTPRKCSILTYFLCEPIQTQQKEMQLPGQLSKPYPAKSPRGALGLTSQLEIIQEEEKNDEDTDT